MNTPLNRDLANQRANGGTKTTMSSQTVCPGYGRGSESGDLEAVVERCAVSNTRRIARVALYIAATASLAVAALLAAAALGIWMENMQYHPTPRINSFTVGLGFVPLPALAWIVYLWTCTRPSRALDIVLRIVVSGVLVWGA